METRDDFRWRFYSQARDILLLGTGIGLLIFEAVYRARADTIIVVAALSCVGIFASGTVSRWFLGRMSEGTK